MTDNSRQAQNLSVNRVAHDRYTSRNCLECSGLTLILLVSNLLTTSFNSTYRIRYRGGTLRADKSRQTNDNVDNTTVSAPGINPAIF